MKYIVPLKDFPRVALRLVTCQAVFEDFEQSFGSVGLLRLDPSSVAFTFPGTSSSFLFLQIPLPVPCNSLMADAVATSSSTALVPGEGLANPNPITRIAEENPHLTAAVESPEIQALGGTGDVVREQPL